MLTVTLGLAALICLVVLITLALNEPYVSTRTPVWRRRWFQVLFLTALLTFTLMCCLALLELTIFGLDIP